MVAGDALIPGSGEAWDRAGRFLQFDFAPIRPEPFPSINGVHDDPNSSCYWMDLAEIGTTRASSLSAIACEPSVLPLSATITSPRIPRHSIVAKVFWMQVPHVRLSLRHGITTES